MLFFGKKADSRERQRAENLLLAAEKISRYRGDLFDDADWERFDSAVNAVSLAQKEAASGTALSTATGTLEKVLRDFGGTLFPHKKIPEWVELIVVAAILAGGIRAFFVQPFKIPTNSMFPTYNGMTSEVCTGTENLAAKTFERIFRSASFYSIESPADGEILIPLNYDAKTRNFSMPAAEKTGGFGNIVRPGQDVYSLSVGGKNVPIAVPRDFSLNSILLDSFFPETKKIELPEALRWRNVFKTAQIAVGLDGSYALRTGKVVRRGDKLLDFKILGGDMVIVDRVSYHFREPERGDPFVFRTHNIPGLNNVELYYIKRLAGKPGDTLRVENGKLLVNGAPANAADAFKLNNAPTPEKKYYGYLPTSGNLSPYSWPLNDNFRVPEKYFYALGDNSSNSYDSRGWGGVPTDDVVGKALFILYPFSKRWGLAQ